MTPEYLRSILDYDPLTGVFRWKKTGQIAGGRDRRGYWRIKVDGRYRLAHRLAFSLMTGAEPPPILDHVNRKRGDNRWENIRPASSFQNSANRASQKQTTDLPRGVHRGGRRFRAIIYASGKRTNIGTYSTVQEADTAYRNAAVILHGEFACFDVLPAKSAA